MRPRIGLAAAAVLALALGGCAAADKNAAQNAADTLSTTSTSASANGMSGMNMSGSSSGAGGVVSGSASTSGTATIVNAQGVATPVPIKTIGTGTWKDMDITAQETTPVPFYIDNGTSSREEKPTKATSFHLMVMLSDKHTGQAIPYATVWATISKDGKRVFNEQQWPMLSEYMGPHYGNNVTLPGPGTYKLTVLVSAPVAAMHVEYGGMWKGRHEITSTFTWPTKTS